MVERAVWKEGEHLSFWQFYEMTLQYSDSKENTKQFLEMAMRDEVRSVKARVRDIVKKGINAALNPFWSQKAEAEPMISMLSFSSGGSP